MLPPAFRINDGDLTVVIVSSITHPFITGVSSQMRVEACDVQSGTMKLRIDPKAIGVDDGIAQSVWTCNPASVNCMRSPPEVTPGALLLDETRLTFTLSQIRNLAGGYSATFKFRTSLRTAAPW